MAAYCAGVLFIMLALAGCQAACPPKFNNSNYRIKYNAPENCEEATCDYFVAITTNKEDPKFLDFLIEGKAQGWVAIGFSTDGKMPDADVLACAVNPTNNNVQIIDTYNAGYSNVRDAKQDVCPHASRYSNGRISCSFSRAIDTRDVQDKNFNQSYYLLFGASNKPNSARTGKLSYHNVIPVTSAEMCNPAEGTLPAPIEEGQTASATNEENTTTLSTTSVEINNAITTLKILKNPIFTSLKPNVSTVNTNLISISSTIRQNIQHSLPTISFTTSQDSEYSVSPITPQPSSVNYNANYTPEIEHPPITVTPIPSHTPKMEHFPISSITNKEVEYNPQTTLNLIASHTTEEETTAPTTSLRTSLTPTPINSLPSTQSHTDISPNANHPTDHPTGCPTFTPSSISEHEFQKSFPSNCTLATCNYYISIKTNKEDPDYLDFVMEAQAQGWAAIGFSSTPGMRNADVMACALNPNTRSVVILDTYNVAKGYENVKDTIQNVCLHSASFINGRISCIFSRPIKTGDVQDKDLSKDYYQLYGAVDDSPNVQGNDVQLSYHSNLTPIVSDDTVSILSQTKHLASVFNGETFVTPSPPEASTISSVQSRCPLKPPADAKYRLQITIAPSCAEPGRCGYFMMGIRTNDHNPKYLDFVLEGDALGWVAVGFSPTRGMPDADVLACALNPTNNNVEIIDTYNAGYSNVRDAKQDVCPHFSNYSNGRISCSFSRAIETGDDQDKDLNQPYHLLYGAVDAKPNTVKPNTLLQLKYHGAQVPIATSIRVNPSLHHEALNSSGSHFGSKHMLVLAHGVLMLVAWPLLATIAIFFASWMKPALPKGGWFQVHRALMVGSLVVGVAAFILIFVSNKDSIYPGLVSFSTRESAVHFAIGVLVMALHIANPLISVVRCTPDAPRRWIFNVIHGSTIGVGAYLLALINVAIGIFLLEKDQRHILWVYLAFVALLTLLLLALFVIFTVIAAKSEDAPKLGPPVLKPLLKKLKPSGQTKPLGTSSTTMLNMVSPPVPGPEAPAHHPTKEKVASEDAPLRWAGLAILLAVVLPMVTVIGIKIAIKT